MAKGRRLKGRHRLKRRAVQRANRLRRKGRKISIYTEGKGKTWYYLVDYGKRKGRWDDVIPIRRRRKR